LFFEQLTLRSHVVSVFATYGLTDRWDVNLLLPVIFTHLKVRARARVNNESGTSLHFFANDVRMVEQVRSVDDDKTGVGDLLLRTKYHLVAAQGFNLATGLVLRLPLGEEDDFQGLGDTTLTSFVTLSKEYGRLDVHASGGIELNWDDSDRSRVRYAVGTTLPVLERVAFLVDVIGSSSLKSDRVSVSVPQFFDPPPAPATSFIRASTRLRTDIVDLAVGFKANLVGAVVGFATVFVPLNDDGLRAEVIPVVGLETSF
jgi:hypothetical protein